MHEQVKDEEWEYWASLEQAEHSKSEDAWLTAAEYNPEHADEMHRQDMEGLS